MIAEYPTTPEVRRLRRILLALCGVIVLIASVDMFGWLIRSKALVQLHPSFAPMQFNTALCFATAAGAVLANGLRRLNLAQGCLAVLAFVAGLTAAEYVFGLNTGIDTLFAEPFITSRTALRQTHEAFST